MYIYLLENSKMLGDDQPSPDVLSGMIAKHLDALADKGELTAYLKRNIALCNILMGMALQDTLTSDNDLVREQMKDKQYFIQRMADTLAKLLVFNNRSGGLATVLLENTINVSDMLSDMQVQKAMVSKGKDKGGQND